MTFRYSEKSEEWQTLYPRDQAHRESGIHSMHSSLLLFAGVIIASTYLSVFVVSHFNTITLNIRLAIVLFIALLLIIAAAFSLAYSRAIRFGVQFMREFYSPPEEVDIAKLIQYRLNGVPKLPPPLNLLFRFDYILAKEGSLVKPNQWPAWSSRYLGGPLILIVFDGCALYLERGNRFSRVVGPGNGSPFLEWHERIKYVVDLRPKVKEGFVDVWTKDGIRVRFDVKIECRIGDPKKKNHDSTLVYPYDPVAVKKAIERHSVRWLPDRKNGNPTEFTWIDAAWGQVTSVVPNYIGARMLDDLFIADRQGGQILSDKAVQEIFNQLNENTQKFGVFVTDFQVSKIDLPQEVETALREIWKAEKQSAITIKDGESRAIGIREQEEARARAQRDLIIKMAEGFLNTENKNYTEPILLTFSRILDESLDEPLMRAYLASQTLETLDKIKDMLK